jgi:hypothetical protein
MGRKTVKGSRISSLSGYSHGPLMLISGQIWLAMGASGWQVSHDGSLVDEGVLGLLQWGSLS